MKKNKCFGNFLPPAKQLPPQTNKQRNKKLKKTKKKKKLQKQQKQNKHTSPQKK